MNRYHYTFVLFALSVAAVALVVNGTAGAESKPLETVPSVDLRRYIGRWYEIARYPNRFQRKCTSDTAATYTLRDDGKIEVVNSCRQADGNMSTARGTARVKDTQTNAKLKVSFFWPFSGDYWIIGLGRNYEYAVVGEPSRKYLWILSRTSHLDERVYEEAISIVRERGYDPALLIRTPQHAPGK